MDGSHIPRLLGAWDTGPHVEARQDLTHMNFVEGIVHVSLKAMTTLLILQMTLLDVMAYSICDCCRNHGFLVCALWFLSLHVLSCNQVALLDRRA